MKSELLQINITLRSDGIIHVVYPAGVEARLTDAQDVLARRKILAPGIKSAVLVEAERGDPFERKSRNHFGGTDFEDHTLALAIVGNRRITAMLVNISMRVISFACPVRFFTNREEAIAWLHQCQDNLGFDSGIQAEWQEDSRHLDMGRQAVHISRLYFAVSDILSGTHRKEDIAVLPEAQKMQMRQLARDLESELRNIGKSQRFQGFMTENGVELDVLEQDLKRFNDLLF